MTWQDISIALSRNALISRLQNNVQYLRNLGGGSVSAPSGEILFGNAGGDGVESDPGLAFDRVLTLNDGLNNIGIGDSDTLSTIDVGQNNVAIGSQVLRDNVAGSANVGVGLAALIVTTTGSNNVAIGDSAGQISSGESNTAIGSNAMGAYTGNVTGSHNTALGFEAGANLTAGSRNIAIGKSVDVADGTANDQLNIGNLITGNMASGSKQATIDGRLAAKAPDSAIADGDVPTSAFSFYLDEMGNALTVKVKYANGTTIKTGTIALT